MSKQAQLVMRVSLSIVHSRLLATPPLITLHNPYIIFYYAQMHTWLYYNIQIISRNMYTSESLSIVSHGHVVLSTLYQEKMVTEEELKNVKPVEWIWPHFVKIQCTKEPAVVARTAKLLTEVRHNVDRKLLEGQ